MAAAHASDDVAFLIRFADGKDAPLSVDIGIPGIAQDCRIAFLK